MFLSDNGIMMTRQEQFLLVVQTAILTNSIHLATDAAERVSSKATYSATGVLSVMDEAIRASERIPFDKTPFQAAHEFCFFMLENLREPGAVCPEWFARY
jgi:hypothetical protein